VNESPRGTILSKTMKHISTSTCPYISKFLVIPLLLLVVFTANQTCAEQGKDKPLWELGVVGICGYGPDYPAADDSRLHAIALPYFVYRVIQGDVHKIIS